MLSKALFSSVLIHFYIHFFFCTEAATFRRFWETDDIAAALFHSFIISVSQIDVHNYKIQRNIF